MGMKVKAVEKLLKFNKNENDPFRRRAVAIQLGIYRIDEFAECHCLCLTNSIASLPVRCSMSKRIISIRERPCSSSFCRDSSSLGL